MEPHGVPSGGDWALERIGAVLLEGTQSATVANCTFTRIDGNAVFISGYNRNATIAQSTFEWLGQSAIAAWGLTDDWDGTGGEQPRFTTIIGNIAYSIGLIQKQSSFYFQVSSFLARTSCMQHGQDHSLLVSISTLCRPRHARTYSQETSFTTSHEQLSTSTTASAVPRSWWITLRTTPARSQAITGSLTRGVECRL
jgi:hypothetical protein